MKNLNAYAQVAAFVYACIYPLVLFLLLEMLNPASSDGLFFEPWQNMGSAVYSAAIIFLVSVIAYSLIGSVFFAYAATTFVLVLAYIVNHFKIMVTGGVFVPSDLALASAAFSVMDADTVVIERTFLAVMFFVLLFFLPLYFAKLKTDLRQRLVLLPASTLLFAVVFVFGFFAYLGHGALGLTNVRTIDRYRDNGFLLGFFSELVGIGNPVFANISTWEITAAFSGSCSPGRVLAANPQSTREASQTVVNPNVIVIMSESFFDPNVLPNISFSQNPVPNFHRMQASHLSGSLIVPTWGGGTANTEFEFLAGSPHVFFGNRWYVPFENVGRYFSGNIKTALPWMFRDAGYRTVGVHTFYGTFFNRDRIYPRLGFDMFISSEDMPNAAYRGRFISDEYFTDRLMEQIVFAEESGEPLFLFGISMQNHWPFYEEKFYELDVYSESPYLSCVELGIMDSFLQGIFDADKQLGSLIDFIESRDTPTNVVFFGDHLPILGTRGYGIFEKLGFLGRQEEWAWSLGDLEAAFSTNYLVWANFDHGRECFGTLSAFMLGALVAEMSGVNLNRYFMYLLGASRSIRVLTNELFMLCGGKMDYGFTNRSNREVQLLESLWNHKMFGRGDFARSLSEIIE